MAFLTSLFVGIFLLSTVIKARIEDSVSISVDDTNFSASKAELKNMLDKADLESHGYEREEVNKQTTDSSGRRFYSKSLFYFKAIRCSEARQTIEELKNLLPGIMTPPMVAKLQMDLKAQDTTHAGLVCKIGLKTSSNERRVSRPKRWLGSVTVSGSASVGGVTVSGSVTISCCR